MGQRAYATATPKLRLQKFERRELWNVEPLASVADFISERVSVAEISAADYVSTENLLPDYGGKIAASRLPPAGVVTRYRIGDVLISNIRPYLKKVWVADQDGGASNDIVVVRARRAVSASYLAHVLANDAFISYVMRGARGVKMPRGDVAAMYGYPVAYPRHDEQQEIAGCLTSLQELIAAQDRTVEALKAHKRGLMQQLFPREGEAVPRLRFPEFRDEAEWRVVRADSLFRNRREKGERDLPMYSVTMYDGMVLRSSLDRECDEIQDPGGNKRAHPRDIVYNMMRMWQGALGVAPEDCVVSPAYVILAPQREAVPEFFAYFFKTPTALRFLTSHSHGLTADRLRLYYDDFARIMLPCPSEREQQKIAACLSSVDAEIAANAGRLQALTTHRRYLMGQLFPAPNPA